MTGSITSVKGFPGFSVYAASKATLLAFARGWLNELKGRNIRVNVLVPGQVATPILEQVFDEETTRHPPSCHVAALILAVAKFSRLTRGGLRAEGAALRLRLVGPAPIAATVYKLERLRQPAWGHRQSSLSGRGGNDMQYNVVTSRE